MKSTRSYTMTSRARAVEETRRRILDASVDLHGERLVADISLDDIAERAGVSVQTVLRHFGSRAGLVEASVEHARAEVEAERRAPVGDVAAAVRVIVDHYELRGDGVLVMLAQESHQELMARVTAAAGACTAPGSRRSSRRTSTPPRTRGAGGPARGRHRRLHLEAAAPRPRPGPRPHRDPHPPPGPRAARDGRTGPALGVTVPEILFVTWDGGGNVPPALGIATELATRGHRVRFLGHAANRGAVEAAGFEHEAYATARPFSSPRARVPARPAGDVRRPRDGPRPARLACAAPPPTSSSSTACCSAPWRRCASPAPGTSCSSTSTTRTCAARGCTVRSVWGCGLRRLRPTRSLAGAAADPGRHPARARRRQPAAARRGSRLRRTGGPAAGSASGRCRSRPCWSA